MLKYENCGLYSALNSPKITVFVILNLIHKLNKLNKIYSDYQSPERWLITCSLTIINLKMCWVALLGPSLYFSFSRDVEKSSAIIRWCKGFLTGTQAQMEYSPTFFFFLLSSQRNRERACLWLVSPTRTARIVDIITIQCSFWALEVKYRKASLSNMILFNTSFANNGDV